jgi:hypothetical protein
MTDFCVTLWELSSMPAVQSFCLGIALLVAGAFLLRDSEPDNGVSPPKGKADSDRVAWRNARRHETSFTEKRLPIGNGTMRSGKL